MCAIGGIHKRISWFLAYDRKQQNKQKKISEQILSLCILNSCKEIDVGCFAVIILGYIIIRHIEEKFYSG